MHLCIAMLRSNTIYMLISACSGRRAIGITGRKVTDSPPMNHSAAKCVENGPPTSPIWCNWFDNMSLISMIMFRLLVVDRAITNPLGLG